jgi:hypothetical protein
MAILRSTVEQCLFDGYIATSGARLREEDATKTDEMVGLLNEIALVVSRMSKKNKVVLVDAAAGKGYVGILTAKLILEPLRREAKIVFIERNERLLNETRVASQRLNIQCDLDFISSDVNNIHIWPLTPSIVVALHACGSATDVIIGSAIEVKARAMMIVPCCVGATTKGTALANDVASALAFPSCAPIQRKLIHAVVDAERVLNCESAGYQTQALEFVPAHVTPWNTLLRCQRVLEPVRQARAQKSLAALRQFKVS